VEAVPHHGLTMQCVWATDKSNSHYLPTNKARRWCAKQPADTTDTCTYCLDLFLLLLQT